MKPGDSQPELPKGAGEATIARLDKLRTSSGPLSTFAIRRNMQRTMQARPVSRNTIRAGLCSHTLQLIVRQ